MSKKLYAALLPVLAVAAFAMAPAAAQAAPHWFICEKLGAETGKFTDSECENSGKGFWEWIEVGNEAHKVRVITWGTLTFKVLPNGPTIRCMVSDRGFIWNTEVRGKDEVTHFENFECETVEGTCPTPEIRANGLPWKTELITGPLDKILGISVTVFCGGAEVGTFTGELSPEIGNGVAKFTATTGRLKAGTVEAEVTGEDFIETWADQEVTAK